MSAPDKSCRSTYRFGTVGKSIPVGPSAQLGSPKRSSHSHERAGGFGKRLGRAERRQLGPRGRKPPVRSRTIAVEFTPKGPPTRALNFPAWHHGNQVNPDPPPTARTCQSLRTGG
jgi:hypothetical protein